MNKLSLPPRRDKTTSEADIEAIINKGGQPAPTPASQDDFNPEAIKHINTRLTAAMIRQIDELRAQRPRRIGSPKKGISLRDWIVEAVVEKIDRDSKK